MPFAIRVPVQAPEAVQVVAPVVFQVRVVVWPDSTDEGLAVNVRVGAGTLTITVTL